jgi:hypothetical protein
MQECLRLRISGASGIVPVPQLSEEQTAWIIQQVAEYIGQQRQNLERQGGTLDARQRSAMQSFFPPSALDSTKVVVLAGEQVGNPPFYPALKKLGFDLEALPNFAFIAAITFVDTVVFPQGVHGQAPVPRTRPRRPVRKTRLATVRCRVRYRFLERRRVRGDSAGNERFRVGCSVCGRASGFLSGGRGSSVD